MAESVKRAARPARLHVWRGGLGGMREDGGWRTLACLLYW